MWARMEAWLQSRRLQLGIPPREQGQGLVEYAMILVLAVLLVIILLTFFAPWLNNVYIFVISVL
jgi:Flp pilus assembly pilin Flp